MRIRNLKNKEEILSNCHFLINNPEEYVGKWLNLFANKNPIHIEIGMGKGLFIIEMAKANPNINFIGIEKNDSIIARAITKLDEELPNLKYIRTDAINIDKLFKKEISLIYLNFSDPWPKLKHSKRRLTDKLFLEKYDEVFKDKKIIKLKTDNDILFSSSIVSLSNYGYMFKEVTLDLKNSNIENIKTEYEIKFIEKGIKIKYLEAIK
ncbi:MAG TPA: tRNA (guanosine(46)-N7)-methyltransferase TrmB [Bacilli bacterium]|nr:tRNA (guanosine(46)-N7)-methyltransferase TrmB [Bacilli bacterium]